MNSRRSGAATLGVMKPNFALKLSLDGIALLKRSSPGWDLVGEVAADADDLSEQVSALRDMAELLIPGDAGCKVVIPNDQIRFLTVPAGPAEPRARQRAVELALDGATPYALDELVFDCNVAGDQLQIAAVANETLEEAEVFARDHGFRVLSYVATPDTGTYMGEPFFGTGPTVGADEAIEPDILPIRVLGRVRMPEPVAPVSDVAEIVDEVVSEPKAAQAELPLDVAETPDDGAADAGTGDDLTDADSSSGETPAPASEISDVSADQPSDAAPDTPPEDPPGTLLTFSSVRRAAPDTGPNTGPRADAPARPARRGGLNLAPALREAGPDAATAPSPQTPFAPAAQASPGAAPKLDPVAPATAADQTAPALGTALLEDEGDPEAAPALTALPQSDGTAPPVALDQAADTPSPARPNLRAMFKLDAATPDGAAEAQDEPGDAKPGLLARITSVVQGLRPNSAEKGSAETGSAETAPKEPLDGAKPDGDEAPQDKPAGLLSRLLTRKSPDTSDQSEVQSEAPETPEAKEKRSILGSVTSLFAGKAAEADDKTDQALTARGLTDPDTKADDAPDTKAAPKEVAKGAPMGGAASAKSKTTKAKSAKKPKTAKGRIDLPVDDAPKDDDVDAAQAAALSASLTKAKTPTAQTEADRMTVFGARRAQQERRSPRFLGLILTVILLLFMAGVAAWAKVFMDDSLSALLRRSPAVETVAIPAAPAGDNMVAAAIAPTSPVQVQPVAPTAPQGTELAALPQTQTLPSPSAPAPSETVPDQAGATPPQTEAGVQARYAATGIWHRAPDAPTPPTATQGLEARPAAFGPVALRDPAQRLRLAQPDATPQAQTRTGPPEPPVQIIQGPPPLTPPARPNLPQRTEAAPAPATPGPFAEFRPKARPGSTSVAFDTPVAAPAPADTTEAVETPAPVEVAEPERPRKVLPQDLPAVLRPPAPIDGDPDRATQSAGVTDPGAVTPPQGQTGDPDDVAIASQASLAATGVAAVRPRPRPVATGDEAAADVPGETADGTATDGETRAAAAAGLASTVDIENLAAAREGTRPEADFVALRPQRRPDNIAQLAAAARARPVPPPAVTPSVPSRASVTRQATIQNAIDLSQINLIGVYGQPTSRRALIRLENGRYRKVKVGDRLDGGRILAIGEDSLRYQKDGRNLSLAMPAN